MQPPPIFERLPLRFPYALVRPYLRAPSAIHADITQMLFAPTSPRLLLIIVLLNFNIHPALAQECPTESYLLDRLGPLSTTQPTMSARIDSNPVHKQILSAVIVHFDTVGIRKQQGDPEGGLWVCEENPGMRDIFGAARHQVQHFGWGELHNCVAIIHDGGNNRTTHMRSKKLFASLTSFTKAVESLSQSVLRSYGLPWNSSFSNDLLAYNPPDVYRTCSIASALAFRVQGRWAVSAQLTNVTIRNSVKKFERGYFQEIISIDSSNTTVPLKFKIPTCSDKNLTGFKNGTATLATWGGRPSSSHFQTRSLGENPAILEALQRGEHEKELVEDSDTASNLAILLLPAGLALVPLGLFQDVSFSLSLLYTLATDVVSVLPVLIKGIELLVYSSKTHYATVSQVLGADTLTDVAVAETWVASCTMKNAYRVKGIALLATAIAAMLIGILLEFFTRQSIDRFKKKMAYRSLREGAGLLWYLHRAKDRGEDPPP